MKPALDDLARDVGDSTGHTVTMVSATADCLSRSDERGVRRSRRAWTASAFIKYLLAPAAARTIKAKGMEPGSE